MARPKSARDVITPLFEHLKWLAKYKMQLRVSNVAERLGVDDPNITQGMMSLRNKGLIDLEVRRATKGRRLRLYRVTIIETGHSTMWPPEVSTEPVMTPMREQELLAERRAAVEQNRLDHQRFWLSRERRPGGPAQVEQRFHLDKETQRALQGGYL